MNGASRNASLWRAFLLTLCALGMVLCFVQPYANLRDYTRSGIVLRSANQNGLQSIARVIPASPAERGGLRAGQIIDVRPMSAPDRYRLYNPAYRGAPLTVYVVGSSGLVPHKIDEQAKHSLSWDVWVAYAGIAWMLAFAAVLAVRCAYNLDARTLAGALVALSFGSLLLPGNWITPLPWLDALASTFSCACVIPISLLATYALSFARPPSRERIMLTWLAYVIAGGVAILGVAQVWSQWTGTFDASSPIFVSPLALFVVNCLPYLLPVVCGIAAGFAAHASERSRFLWAFVPLGLTYLGNFADFSVFNPHFSVAHIANNITAFVAPLGLTYSLLSRRVLDIGFVLNRAVVFSGVSIVLIGAFVLVEWALSEWMSGLSHGTNLAVSATLALGLGLSMRFVHGRVETFVDKVMFRKRREDEEAIRRMAREAAYITDRDVLLARTAAVAERNADATFAKILLGDTWGDENDPALVTLRATHDVLDLHGIATAFDGDLAFPMVARGRLLGVFLVGPKHSQEAFAPDEIDALRHLSHNVAAALDVFELKQNDASMASVSAIHSAFALLSSQLSDISRQIANNNFARPSSTNGIDDFQS